MAIRPDWSKRKLEFCIGRLHGFHLIHAMAAVPWLFVVVFIIQRLWWIFSKLFNDKEATKSLYIGLRLFFLSSAERKSTYLLGTTVLMNIQLIFINTATLLDISGMGDLEFSFFAVENIVFSLAIVKSIFTSGVFFLSLCPSLIFGYNTLD